MEKVRHVGGVGLPRAVNPVMPPLSVFLQRATHLERKPEVVLGASEVAAVPEQEREGAERVRVGRVDDELLGEGGALMVPTLCRVCPVRVSL